MKRFISACNISTYENLVGDRLETERPIKNAVFNGAEKLILMMKLRS